MMVPSRQTSIELIRKNNVPEHIFRHCNMVRRVAVTIGFYVNECGGRADTALIDRAALLHDICKMKSIESGGDHAAMGRELLENCGYSRVGDVVRQHVKLDSLEMNEAMIVNYADKRVKHDRVVSLDERFEDLLVRYGTTEQKKENIRKLFKNACKVEDIITLASGVDVGGLCWFNLVPGDYPLYC